MPHALTLRPKRESLTTAPQTIGVYIFYGRSTQEVLYVGKSINLKARLLSHWESARFDERERAIFEGSRSIKLIPIDSEFKALLYEAELIRKLRPRYNRIWMDDKSALYIKITVRDEYPKVLYVRKENDGRSVYFGPFSSIRVVERLLKEVRKAVPFCAQPRLGKAPCFYAKIGLCNPCPNAINALPAGPEKEALKRQYRANIRQIVSIFKGKAEPVLKALRAQMKRAAAAQEYEEAMRLRDRTLFFERLITERIGLEKEMAEGVPTVNAAESLQRTLLHYWPQLPPLSRIECYDISNLSFKQATAAMVVATDGIVDKSQYRKFKIKNPKANSDFVMMYETLLRRFRNKWPAPDLLLVDGGKPQVRIALQALAQLGRLNIPVAGIAKRPDRLVMGLPDLPTVRLPLRHPGFNLVRALRDEAHRFSKKYHVELRGRALMTR